ncbi:MAG: sugar phosphate isomerase/epimerase [Deltaproteobacteria bacterium]|nr:sugar phosphate isomerase/epimerase [Deltaproteobacteria bacterium]
MTWIADKIQVNIPFTMLYESYLDRFIEYRINPEIGFDAMALDRYSLSDVETVADKINNHGLSVTLHAPFMDLSPGSPDPMIRGVCRNRFEKLLQFITPLRPKSIVFHSGYDEKRYWHIKEEWMKKSLEFWLEIIESIRDKGTMMMIENVFEHSPYDLKILFEKLRSKETGFCLDTGHQQVFSRTSIEDWVDILGPFIAQLHLHDNNGVRDEHLALGRGIIDFRLLFEKLSTIRETPPIVTLEPHKEEDLWPSIVYLEEIWPWQP